MYNKLKTILEDYSYYSIDGAIGKLDLLKGLLFLLPIFIIIYLKPHEVFFPLLAITAVLDGFVFVYPITGNSNMEDFIENSRQLYSGKYKHTFFWGFSLIYMFSISIYFIVMSYINKKPELTLNESFIYTFSFLFISYDAFRSVDVHTKMRKFPTIAGLREIVFLTLTNEEKEFIKVLNSVRNYEKFVTENKGSFCDEKTAYALKVFSDDPLFKYYISLKEEDVKEYIQLLLKKSHEEFPVDNKMKKDIERLL